MPFDPNSAKKAGKKSKRGPAKKEGPSIKQKMEILYEKVLDDLLINQEKLTKTERVKLFVTLSNYIFPKTKSVRDQFTIEQLKEIEKQGNKVRGKNTRCITYTSRICDNHSVN